MKYFAYGSNMNFGQMKKRCPSAKYTGKASLRDYKFVYDGESRSWGGKAVANIVESPGDIVWGGLFEINEDNLAALDRCEGFNKSPKTYDRKEMDFINEKNSVISAIIYFRIGQKPGNPSEEYKQVVIGGANNCKLDKKYIAKYL